MIVAIATCREYPNLSHYDRGIIRALASRGIQATPVIWNDQRQAWRRAGLVLLQSTWDYYFEPWNFLRWVDKVENCTSIFNTSKIVHWNIHKQYLRDLRDRGIDVTPSIWLKRGARLDIARIRDEYKWRQLVVKPAISASAANIIIANTRPSNASVAQINELCARNDVLVQPYLNAYEVEGERSYIFINGAFSHAVVRHSSPRAGVHGFGRPRLIETPPFLELELSRTACKAVEDDVLYARVDIVTNNDGVPRVQEVELIEPCLYMSLFPKAAELLADAIMARLETLGPPSVEICQG